MGCTATPPPVDDLRQVPWTRAAKLRPSILAHLDQDALLHFLGQQQPYPSEKLMALVDAGMQHGAIQWLGARMPHDGARIRLVNLNELQEEFNGFIRQVEQGLLPLDQNALRKLLRKNPCSSNRFQQKMLAFLRPVMENMLGNPTMVSWLARLCFDRPALFLALTMMSPFPACQILEEIVPLFHLVRRRRPLNILEIGTCFGGNFFLLSRMADDAATLVTMDLRIPRKNLLKAFGRQHQHLVLIEGDSSSTASLEQVQGIFPQGLDLLFIDGDHSYDGAVGDFTRYSPLVKPGGLIVFHDIVEDNATRYGVDTGGWSGGVPRLWRELRSQYSFREFIRNPLQDGAGIGVLFVA